MKNMHGNSWNLTPCNRIVAERMESRRHAKHINALESTRAVTDHSSPLEYPHLRSKPKTRKLQEDRAAEIQLENRILLQKMLNIDTKPSQFSGDVLCSARYSPRTLHGAAQRRELDRITADNQGLLARLQNTKPSINPRIWEEDELEREALKYRLSQNSSRSRPLKLPMPQVRAIGAAPFLPEIGRQNSQFREATWAPMTQTELDQKLLKIENGQGPDLV